MACHPLVENMSSCSDDEFLDKLLRRCSKCMNCGQNQHRACKSYCEILSCNDAVGFYWDKLLRKCIKCSDVCGQHPPPCSEICYEITSSNQDPLPTVRHCLLHEEYFNIWVIMVLAVSLCVVTCVFLMLLVCCVKRGVSTCDTAVASHKTNASSKDGLLQLGVEGGDDQNQSISSEPSSSEPSETCSYCFSEQRTSDKERKLLSNMATPHQCIQIPPAADTKALPFVTVYKEKPFQIICSPSQPSTK